MHGYGPMKKPGLIISLSCGLLFGLLAAALPARADIYSWTDEDGVRHFSDRPPQNSHNVAVAPEIPLDPEADEKSRAALQEMLQQVEEERQVSEKRELEKRLERTEKKLEAAERKAEQALDQAKEARGIAEEKQRRREVYVVPWIGPGKGGGKRPMPRKPYQHYTSPRQDAWSGSRPSSEK